MITAEKLLGILEHECISATKALEKSDNSAMPNELIDDVRTQFAQAISAHGDIADKKSLEALCKSLSTVQSALKGNLPQRIYQRITAVRSNIKERLLTEEGWRREKIVKNGRVTETGLQALNNARQAMGLTTVVMEGKDFYTEEELRAFRAIALELGDAAVAEFLCALRPDKFAFNNRTIQNLRKWLGSFESYRGNAIDDVPVPLLTMPELKCLRDLLFNRMRDKYFAIYSKDGIEEVLAELARSKDRAQEEARKEFIDEIIAYFKATDSLPHSPALKESLITGNEFPGKHQRIAIMEIERQKQLLIADGMGGGKTGSAIAGFEHLKMQGKAKRALVLCPSEIVNEWMKRLSNGANGYFTKDNAPKVVVIRSGDEDRGATWEEAKTADYVVMSFDMARQKTGGLRHDQLAREIGADYFVIDEAHNVKNPDGEDTERMYTISQCETIRNGYTVLLSGTPVPNTIQDIAAQLRLLNAGQPRSEQHGGNGIDFHDIKSLTKAIATNHTRLVRNLLLLRMLHRNTEECLPVGTDIIIEPPRESGLSTLEDAYYQAIFEDPFYSATEKIQLLHRICLHDNAMNPRMSTGGTGLSKYQQLTESIDEFLAELTENPEAHSGKIIVASSGYSKGVTRDFNDNNDPLTSNNNAYIAGKLRTRMAERNIPVFILDGTNTDTKHLKDSDGNLLYDIDGSPMTATRKIIAAFRDHPGPAVLCTRTDVIGEGVDLSFASRGILLSPPPTMAKRDQFVSRMHRRGQKKRVILRTLQTANSIERGLHEYAERKQRVIWDLLNGMPLTKSEEEMLNEDSTRVRRGGFLAYETMTPAHKVMFIFRRIMGAGKERIREFFEMDGGKYARELSELYHQDWETSYSGNNARLITGLVQKHLGTNPKTEKVKIADIACGGLTLARMLQTNTDVEVWSSDINPHMLEIGKKLVNDPEGEHRVTECSMDGLPYADGSMDMAVNSLALHYTKHAMRNNTNGGERIQALHELNRVLKKDGIGILSFPPFVFHDREKMHDITDTIEQYFGFEVVWEDSGTAYSLDEEENKFETFVMTLRKKGAPSPIDNLPPDAWKKLTFLRKTNVRDRNKTERSGRQAAEHSQEHRAYHKEFAIGNELIVFNPSEEHLAEEKTHKEGKKAYQTLRSGVESLIDEFGSIKKIPPEKLLSISLEEIDSAHKEIKDRYFKLLIEKYGDIQSIPLDELSQETPVILLRGETKKKGPFVCIASTNGKKISSRGKRYFYENEFRAVAPEASVIPDSVGKKKKSGAAMPSKTADA